MDGLGGAASILAVVELAARSVSICLEYGQNVKNAKKDILLLRQELINLEKILQEASTCTSNFQPPNEALNCIDACSKDLSGLLAELEPGKTKKWAAKVRLRELKWPLETKEIDRTIQRIARHKETITLAFQISQSARLDSIETKIDLTKLPYVKGAAYNSFSEIDELDSRCLPNTRIDLLERIREWVTTSASKCVFWLNGMAGTGKSTIARTLAAEFDGQKQLGATFFFKNGEGDRGKASCLFTTIAAQLVQSVPEVRPLIREAIEDDPNIADKALRTQFEQLVLYPLQKIKNPVRSFILIVIDALDECDNKDHVKAIVQLLSQLQRVQTMNVRTLITSRPELPPRLGFRNLEKSTYQDFILHEIEEAVIGHDIRLFFEHKFEQIRSEAGITAGWPDKNNIEALTTMAIPLFIFAATVCRFIGHASWEPQERLTHVLEYQGKLGLDQIARTYKPILDRILDADGDDEDNALLVQKFRNVVGPIVVLADYLPVNSLASLLQMNPRHISHQLDHLHSVLDVTDDLNRPIRPLHLSFPNYLLDTKRRDQNQFWIDETAMHRRLAYKCIELLRSSKLLKQDICALQKPGFLRSEIEQSTLSRCIPSELQYACCYWVHHLEQGQCKLSDQDEFHLFLIERFLWWLEALSLIGRVSTAIGIVTILRTLANEKDSPELANLLRDAQRFVLANHFIADIAPLQLYCSSLVFAPQRSIIRSKCVLPKWLTRYPAMEETWNGALQTLEGHSDSVRSVAFSLDGKQLASCSSDKTVKIWDASTGRLQQTLEGHSGGVFSVTFSPGKQLASCSSDKTVKIWCASTGSLQQTLEEHSGGVNSVAFSPDGKQLASCSSNKTVKIKIWDTSTGRLQQTLETHSGRVRSVAFSPDGKQLASCSSNKTVKIWNASTGSLQQTLKGHKGHSDWVRSITFSPDGKQLASCSSDKTVKIWNVSTGSLQQTLEGHSGGVNSVAFSPGKQLASCSCDRTVKIWDTSTGRLQQTLEGHSDWVRSVVFSSDGKLLASCSDDKTVKIWEDKTNASTGSLQQTLEGHSDWVRSVAFSPDGKLLASCSSDKTVKIWDASTGCVQQTLEGHSSYVTSISFLFDSKLLASCSSDKTVKIWDASTGRLQQTLEGHSDWVNSVAFSPDGKQLASCSSDKTVKIWCASTGRLQQTLEGHLDWVRSVAFSPDGELLASCSYGKTVKMWDDKTVKIWNASTGSLHQTIEVQGIVYQISFHPTLPMLNTNIGQIGLDHQTINGFSVNIKAADNLHMVEDWIMNGDEKVLWLPPEYRGTDRGTECASMGQTFVLGSASGRVMFFEFSFEG